MQAHETRHLEAKSTPAERVAVVVLKEMPDEDDPEAVRAWTPSATFRDAVRSAVLATLTSAPGRGRGRRRSADSPPAPGWSVPRAAGLCSPARRARKRAASAVVDELDGALPCSWSSAR